MGIFFIILIGPLIYLLIQVKSNDIVAKIPSKITSCILTTMLLSMALLQSPIFYYYSFGLFTLFIGISYLLISISLTVVLAIPIVKGKSVSAYQKIGVLISILFGTTSLVFGSEVIEHIDWKLRRKEREEIVNRIISGEIDSKLLKTNYFPPISNAGNEVAIYKNSNGEITVTFYIDRGFIDHYSAFVYTNDKVMKATLDGRTKSDWHLTNKKIDHNWYRVSY